MNVAGKWRITEMDLWDLDAIELLGPGFINFDSDNTGHFRFIAVDGWMDCRDAIREGSRAVEFSWSGNDECDPASGRGWASVQKDGSLIGHIYFHLGDDSGFLAVPFDDR
jgi:hypothetical protein